MATAAHLVATEGRQTPPPPARTQHRRRVAGPSLYEIKTKHYLQCSNPITISSFTQLIAELNSAREDDHRTGNQLQRDDRLEWFRHEWLLGALSRVKPLEMLQDGESEVYSDGTPARAGTRSTTPSTVRGALSEEENEERAAPREPLPEEARQQLLPLDAMSRGLVAERAIKHHLATRNQILRHSNFASLATVARRAIRQTLRTGRPVYVAPGLLDSVDWTQEYRDRGWAAPGIRWSVFRPDLIRFQQVKSGKEGDTTTVSWEVVEIKHSNKPRDFIYTNFKIQATFYHLSLARILSNVPDLVPSHKLTFFLSRDPLSPAYEERSVSLRTEQAFVEHHLFVLLPTWLEAVKESDWQRLQDALKESTRSDEAPVTPKPDASTRSTFLEKLQASIKAAPPSPSRPRKRIPKNTPLPSLPSAGRDEPAQTRSSRRVPTPEVQLDPQTEDVRDLARLPALPDPTPDEADLLSDLFDRLLVQPT